MNQSVDLSGFPVIRIDQIPLVDSDTLVQAQKDVKSLIASMLAESDTVPPMVHYLRKQNEATSTELMNRLAQERINSLLNGATALLNNDRSKYLIDDDDEPPPVTKASSTKFTESPMKVSENSLQPNALFQPLPLPSEVRSKRVSALATIVPSIAMSTSDSAASTSHNEEKSSPLSRSKSSPAGIALSSSRSTSERGTKRSDFSQDENAGSDSSPPRRRPMSGDIRPSKRSQEFINNNFGNLFIVAGEGRRRRPVVKKAPAESLEVIKARERLERYTQRKAAMQRLLDRKEERQKILVAKREAKRAAQREEELNATLSATQNVAASPSGSSSRPRKSSRTAQNTAHTTSEDAAPDREQQQEREQDRDQASSGSESVSGGEEEVEEVVDEHMVSAVALAQQQASNEVHSHAPPADSMETSSIVVQVGGAKLEGQSSSRAKPSAASSTTPAAKPTTHKPVIAQTPVTAATERNKRIRPSVAQVARPLSTLTETSTVTPKARNTSKRKSAYRTESIDQVDDPEVQKITIIGADASKTCAIDATPSNEQGEHQSPSPDSTEEVTSQPVTGEELVADFESKNFAALQSLRSMKLKKEQQRLSSLRAAAADVDTTLPLHDVAATTLTVIEKPAVFNHPVDLGSVSVEEGAVENDLTRSTDSEFPPIPSFAAGAVGADSKQKPQLAHVEVPLVPLVLLERPPSRVVRATVSVFDSSDTSSSARDPMRAASAPVTGSPRRVRDPSDEVSAAADSLTQSGSRRRNTSSNTTATPLPSSLSLSVDLSQATLSMAPDLMSPQPLSSTARSVVGPRHPIVFALLAGVKNSSLLYAADGVYCCDRGPEDLPGLCAWKLVSIVDECANWEVNIAKYAEAVEKQQQEDSDARSNEFVTRAATRKSVSLGLLVLLLDCEDLLLGTVRLFNAEHFTTLWKEYIRLFDEKAESAATQWGAQALFTDVGVCGNCHAVCKKLENILKTIFVPKDAFEARLHRKLHAQEGQLPVQVGRLTKPLSEDLSNEHPATALGTTNELDGESQSEFPSAKENFALSTVHSTHSVLHTERSATSLDYSHDTHHSHHDLHAQESWSQLDAASSAELDHAHWQESSVENNNLEGSDIDDEASILPVYHINLGSEEKNIEESAHNITERFMRKPPSTAQQVIPVDGNSFADSTTGTILSNTPSKQSLQSTSIKLSSVQLSDFYPSISAIFPAVYGQNQTTSRQADDGSAAARSLIESMQVQRRIYEEWIEVMSDYSTVFSDDRRGVAENYYGSGGGENQLHGAETGTDGAGNSTVYKGGSRSLHFRVKSARSEVNNIVSDVFNNTLSSWEELPAGLGLGLSWNILWTWSKPRIKLSHLLIWQRVNHYPDSKELTRKDLLKKNIQRYTVHGGKGGEQFNIMPLTYLLPHEYTAFVTAFTAAESTKLTENNQNFWILKPLGMSRGRGISLVKDLSQIAYSVASVVQKYIERPLCLKGYKFDLRLYILVTSFKPLEVFIYRDGFARVSTHQYSLNPEDTENKFIHLTNSSIQVQNTEGPTKDSPLTAGEDEEDTGGTKISLLGKRGLWKRLEEFGIDISALWASISSLVIKSLVMVDDKIAHQPCCFEMFGYDVLIDADLRPWLLEVNASPSLARPSPLDVRVKNAMIRDIIGVLDPAPYDRAAVLRILNKRLSGISKNRFTMGRNDPELESDLKDILGDYVPRRYGEIPANLGNYEMLAPNTKEYERVLKLKKKIIKS